MRRTISVARGKDLVDIRVSGHSHVVIYVALGTEYFRFNSKGKRVSARVEPGRYTVETDGKLLKLTQAKLETELRIPKVDDLRKVPPARK